MPPIHVFWNKSNLYMVDVRATETLPKPPRPSEAGRVSSKYILYPDTVLCNYDLFASVEAEIHIDR